MTRLPITVMDLWPATLKFFRLENRTHSFTVHYGNRQSQQLYIH